MKNSKKRYRVNINLNQTHIFISNKMITRTLSKLKKDTIVFIHARMYFQLPQNISHSKYNMIELFKIIEVTI